MDAETPEWNEGCRPAVLVVDVARKRADPALETAYPAVVDATERIARLLRRARHADVPVLFSRGGRSYYTSGGADLTDTERGGWTEKFPVRDESARQATDALTIAPSLEPADDEIVITKNGPSAFFRSMLPVYLSSLGVDTLIVAGMTTSGCVRATVVDAFSHDYHTIVPADCTADPRREAHEFHLEEMNLKYAHVVSLEKTLDFLDARH